MAEKKHGCFVNLLSLIILVALIAWGMDSCFETKTTSPGYVDLRKQSQNGEDEKSSMRPPMDANKVKLGIQVVGFDEKTRRLFKDNSINIPTLHGVVIINVIANSPERRAGLKVLDILLKLNGRPVRDINSFDGIKNLIEPNDSITYEYLTLKTAQNVDSWQKKQSTVLAMSPIEFEKYQTKRMAEKQEEFKANLPSHNTAIDKTSEMQKQREGLLEELTSKGIFRKIDLRENIPCVWVDKNFLVLDREKKSIFLSVIYAYYFDGTNNSDFVQIKKHLTDNDIGTFDKIHGLRLQ